MASQLTLGSGDGDRRDRLFEALDGVSTGEELLIESEAPVDVPLIRYQITQGVQLSWEREGESPVETRAEVVSALDDALPAFDARTMPPQRRHEVLLESFDRLDPDEGFVLVNDHDPKPLYHELRSTRGDAFEWTYRSEGGDEWRVAIVKTDVTGGGPEDVITSYDVREIPKSERHATIHHRYGMIPEGETLELIAPHEPRPLQAEFCDRYGDTFAWEVVERRPDRCRVHVTKRAAAEGASADDAAAADESPESTDSLSVTAELDVRDLPPAQRHERIFRRYDELDPGEAFVLVNDHDPEPLYHQFDAEAGPAFRWEYRQQEPGEFRVVIGKAADGDAGRVTEPDESERPDAPL